LAILEKEVLVKVRIDKKDFYESKGYNIPVYLDNRKVERVPKNTRILVKVDDLHQGSCTLVTKICDNCGKRIEKQQYYNVLSRRWGSGYDYCKTCGTKEGRELKRNNTPYEKSLAFTHPEVVEMMVDPKLATKITYGTEQKIDIICNNCSFINKNKNINKIIHRGFSCRYCGDGISYPEKFVISTLNQLNVKYQIQKSFSWSESKRYDFYIPSLNCIIETHGKQHYDGGFESYGGRTLEEEQKNDGIKAKIAKENGIEKYIVIDCRYSELEWIQNIVLESELNTIFDLSTINWMKCHNFALTSLVKIVCSMWSYENLTVSEIMNRTYLGRTTIHRYLKKGLELGLCDHEDTRKRLSNGVEIVQLDLFGNLISAYESIAEAGEKNNINYKNIHGVCRGKGKTAGGYKWMYKEDYDQYIKQAK
jgi:hypothetical protein